MRRSNEKGMDAAYRAIAIALAIVVTALLSWTCDKSGTGEQTEQAGTKERPVYRVPSELDRQLTPFELDTLRALKERYGIVRDQYWDDYGGVVANDAVEVWYPDGMVNILQGTAYLQRAEMARRKTESVFGRAPGNHLVIICHGDLEVFRYATGRDWWHYSKVDGDTMSVQPAVDMSTRGLLDIVGQREYFEWAIRHLSEGKCPRWLEEGLASYLSGEAVILENYRGEITKDAPLVLEPKETEEILRSETDRIATRRADYNAYRMVEELVKRRGLPDVAAFVNALPAARDLDDASRKVFDTGYDDLLVEAGAWTKTETP